MKHKDKHITTKKDSILVGVGGGVASLVTAYLFKQRGFNVKAVNVVFIERKNPLYNIFKDLPFIGGDVEGIKGICSQLDIPFYAINASQEFEEYILKKIISYRIVGLNISLENEIFPLLIKLLFSKLEKLNCNKLSVGSFAKIIQNIITKDFEIYIANEYKKDQSHLFSYLKQNILSKIELPLGDLKESEVFKLYNNISTHNIDINKNEKEYSVFNIETLYQNDLFKQYLKNNIPDTLRGDGQIIIYKEEEILGDYSDHSEFFLGQSQLIRSNIPSIDSKLIVYDINMENKMVALLFPDEIKFSHIILQNSYFYPQQEEVHPLSVFIKINQHTFCKGMLYFKSNNHLVFAFDNECSIPIYPGSFISFYNHKIGISKLIASGQIHRVGYYDKKNEWNVFPKTKTEIREESMEDDKKFEEEVDLEISF